MVVSGARCGEATEATTVIEATWCHRVGAGAGMHSVDTLYKLRCKRRHPRQRDLPRSL